MVPLTQLSPGSVFAGDYRIVRPLSSGGMGAVYVAEQLSTGKPRALKVMRPELLVSEQARRRFELEARVGSRIASEHVVETIAAGVDPATEMPWLSMELLEGRDLGKLLGERGPLPVWEVHAIVNQLCHALAAAHAHGIVHRDLKPENVFLAQTHHADVAFTVKVLDFGIARLLSEGLTVAARTTGALGTPLWMAPEQWEAGSEVKPAADVWALGLIVFTLLTGRFFWRSAHAPGASVAMLGMEIATKPIPAASVRAAELGAFDALPPGFDAWFAGCVQRDPAARFPDAGAAWHASRWSPSSRPVVAAFAPTMAAGTVQMTTGAPVAITAPQPMAPVTMPARRPSPWLWVALAGGLVVSAGAVGLFVMTRDGAAKAREPAAASASAKPKEDDATGRHHPKNGFSMDLVRERLQLEGWLIVDEQKSTQPNAYRDHRLILTNRPGVSAAVTIYEFESETTLDQWQGILANQNSAAFIRRGRQALYVWHVRDPDGKQAIALADKLAR